MDGELTIKTKIKAQEVTITDGEIAIPITTANGGLTIVTTVDGEIIIVITVDGEIIIINQKTINCQFTHNIEANLWMLYRKCQAKMSKTAAGESNK